MTPEHDLPRARSRGEILPGFQPEVDLMTGAIVAVEALCRWLHPEDGMIGPADFIPIAERTGDIHQLGQFMLEECLNAAASWREAGADISVSVNVSPLQFDDPTFVEDLADRIRSRGLQDGALTVEITEGVPVAHPDCVHSGSGLPSMITEPGTVRQPKSLACRGPKSRSIELSFKATTRMRCADARA